METLELPGWSIEYDRPATVVAYDHSGVAGPAACGCDPCLNWSTTRERLFPIKFRDLLGQLGIPFDREAEVYHNCRLESGRHSYGAWYHFVGKILFGEQEDSPIAASDSFSISFHSKPVLMPEAFIGQPTVQLELWADVPWLSDIPEAV